MRGERSWVRSTSNPPNRLSVRVFPPDVIEYAPDVLQAHQEMVK